jgi:hypothetical protein
VEVDQAFNGGKDGLAKANNRDMNQPASQPASVAGAAAPKRNLLSLLEAEARRSRTAIRDPRLDLPNGLHQRAGSSGMELHP